jgi:hypothetical protein
MFLITVLVCAQEPKELINRLELSASYGVGGNFYVTSYDEQVSSHDFSKDFIGTIGGVELIWNLKDNKQAFGLSFDRAVNQGEKSVSRTAFPIGQFSIENVNLRYTNNMYGLFYRNTFRPNLSAFLGFYLFSTINQSLEVFEASIYLTEQQLAIEGGFFLGIDYSFYSSGRFEVSIQSKLYSYFAIQEFDLEAISLTPKITYHL